jgi:hypothetical protein
MNRIIRELETPSPRREAGARTGLIRASWSTGTAMSTSSPTRACVEGTIRYFILACSPFNCNN